MKLRSKKNGTEASSSQFNTNAIAEILVCFEDDMDTMYISDFDVWLEKTVPPQWKDMNQAFRDKDLITDDYNSRFFEPENEEDRERGYTL